MHLCYSGGLSKNQETEPLGRRGTEFCAGSAILLLLLLMHQGQEGQTRLGGKLGPSRYKGTNIKPLTGNFPFFAGIFQLGQESLIQGKHPCLLELRLI